MKRPDYKGTFLTLGGIALLYTVLLILLLWLEQDVPGSKLRSVEDGLWFLFATLTTVGYGDIVPITDAGRGVGLIFLISTLGIYGFIIGKIASFMNTLKEQREMGYFGTQFRHHVVIIGWNDFAQSVIHHLTAAGRQVAVVTRDRNNVEIIREFFNEDQVFVLFSDYNNFDLLEKVNIRNASIVFVNLNDDTEKLVYIINIKKRLGELRYIVTLDNGNLKSTFQNAGVTYAISKNEISSKLLASYIFEPDVAFFSEEILAYAHDDNAYDLKQFRLAAGSPLAEVNYEKAFFELKKKCNVVLVGFVRQEGDRRLLYKNPEDDIRLQEGDDVLLLCNQDGLERLHRLFRLREGN